MSLCNRIALLRYRQHATEHDKSVSIVQRKESDQGVCV